MLILSIGWAGNADAQSITRIAPSPTQWGLWSSCFLDAQNGFACGERMSLFKTTDGGSTWSTIALPGWPSEPLYDVTFLDANVGIVCGNSSTLGPDVYRTTDGGTSWARVTTFPLGGSWYHQDYVSSTTGFIGSNGAIVRTSDAGATWSVQSAYPNCPNMTGMDFLDANVGFVSGGLPTSVTGLFKTSDGGFSWQHKLPGAAEDVIYVGPTQLLAVVDGAIVQSTDGGDNWLQIHPPISTGLVDLEHVSAATIVGVSGRGDIWRTTDGGFTWSLAFAGEGDLPGNWSVHFDGAGNGSVAGVHGLIYGSHDGGQTWSRLGHGAGIEANGMTALSADSVVTVGYHGFAQRLGVSSGWDLSLVDPPTFGRNTSYEAVDSVDATFVYAAGDWGGLARSTDGGVTWQNLVGSVSLFFSANDVEFTDSSNGWMTGFDYGQGTAQQTFRTSDGGTSWQLVPAANFPGVALEVIGSNVWLQSGVQANWRSTDGGATFVAGQLPTNSGSAPSVSDLSFANTTTGYACGRDGYLVKTANGGLTWTQLGSMQFNTHILGVLAVDTEVWICGATSGGGNAFVRRSLDGGTTWTTWSMGGTFTTPYQMSRAGARLFVSGYNGEMWMIDGLPDHSPLGQTYCHGDGTGTTCPCGNASTTGAKSGCLNSLGNAGRLRATGSARVSNDTVVLAGTQLPNGPALYFQGTVQTGGGNGAVFGDGLRCVGGTIQRLGVGQAVLNASTYPYGASAPNNVPVSVRGFCAAGDVRYYQVWYRDSTSFCTPTTFNLTNGLSLTWLP